MREELVEQIRDGHEHGTLDERTKLVLRYCDAFLGPSGPADPKLRAEMSDRFTPQEIVELTAGLALFMGFSKIAIALGQAPDSMPTTVVPTPELPESDTFGAGV